MLPNVPQFAVAMAAVLRAGYTCVNVNPLYTARELEHQLKDSGASALIILENFCHTLEEALPHTGVRHVVVTAMGDLLGTVYGQWITFAVRHVAKMVPAYRLSLADGRTVRRGILLAFAYPDRVAQRLAGSEGRYRLAN